MIRKILLADDSITIHKVVRVTLQGGGYEIHCVDNGTEALTKARELRPDLVLADAVMPGADGYEVCRGIKRDPELRGLPVLLLAGSFDGCDEKKAAECGADGWVQKPFASETLMQKINDTLKRTRGIVGGSE